jgi:CRP/FNR family transcriptional regulator, cyclic AMP receptor protein
LFSYQRRLISLRTTMPSVLVLLPQDRLKLLVSQQPRLLDDFYALSHSNVEMMLTLLGNLCVSGADNRIAVRLLIQSEKLPAGTVWVHLSQEDLAALVALSAQSVRRSLRSLESRGLIETGYRKIRVVDRAGLSALCGYSGPLPAMRSA